MLQIVINSKVVDDPHTWNSRLIQGYFYYLFQATSGVLHPSKFHDKIIQIVLSIYNPEKELNDIKETFFSSVNLDGLDSLKQYTGKSNAYRQGYVFGKLFLYTILGIGIFLLIRILRKKK